MRKALLASTLLLMPLVASADVPPAGSVCMGSQGYADAFEGRRTFLWRPDWLAATKARGAGRAAGVLAEYNPTSRIHLTIARP